jgi:hypothetical protein
VGGWRPLGIAAVSVTLLLGLSPATAAAAAHHRLSAAQVIAIARANPKVARVVKANPGSHWAVVYQPVSGNWSVTLEPHGLHAVLAGVTIADATGTIIPPVVIPPGTVTGPHLTAAAVTRIAEVLPSVRSWLSQYHDVTHDTHLGYLQVWTVAYYASTGEVAEVHVNDADGKVSAAWTGPQVGWQLARGEPNSYGRKVNAWYVLWPLCALFVGGLMNWRRPFSLRTLDLVMLLSFAASLEFFNRGDIFVSTPLIYPPMLYLLARMVWIGRSRTPRRIAIGETQMLVLVALVFALMGFRLGLNNRDSGVIDVGYAGVVGASRLVDGVLPYGHFPVAQGRHCAGRYSDGTPVGYVQPDGRCETPIGNGDTYGPAVYLAYVPAVAVFGWNGLWNSLPAAHVTACAFDILAVVGLFVAGWRLADPRIGVMAAFAWAANPFTLYSLNMNSNDGLVGALVAWTLAALSLPRARGVLLALAGFSKAAPLAMLPVFWRLRNRRKTLIGFAIGCALMLSMFLLEPSDWRLLWDRTIAYQAGRITPMSVWTLGDYHPGWPHLETMQKVMQVIAGLGIAVLAVLPRGRRDAAAVAALSGAAILATQLVASYWFYPYICWWLPAVVLGLLLPRAGGEAESGTGQAGTLTASIVLARPSAP